MPTFVPVYRPTTNQQSFLARRQKLKSRKRKRGDIASDDEGTSSVEPLEGNAAPRTGTTAIHPVNKTDPYYVAGHPREDGLPPPPFPHGAVKEPHRPKIPIDEDLAALNPPLYVPSAKPEDRSTSLKRRHLDNLTTILHRCMLRGDWQRASRAWAILVRAEIAGRGIDVRRNGRWSIGAELLMRRGLNQSTEEVAEPPEPGDPDVSSVHSEKGHGDEDLTARPQFSDEGFKLAREYYERLILQYPHTVQDPHIVNAMVFYPALFNIWIFEVQDRSKRARGLASTEQAPDENEAVSASDRSSNADPTAQISSIRANELEEALPIAQRMDELLLGPPYDTMPSLLQLRAMVALWLSDLYSDMASLPSSSLDTSFDSDVTSPDGPGVRGSRIERQQALAESEQQRARSLFSRLAASGVELPAQVADFVTK
ncbi:hypothetical protein LTR37_019076 [Vermiconidia calcicola]|uniref:Uncharacterized protein n=1 Tax=Vermiconidia calcicola TaxID=1690605 RepID=A0ACC3MH11_9PEZI|nr:hypothetical protein LTR37_019076 [Vermiconidia calcicola]